MLGSTRRSLERDARVWARKGLRTKTAYRNKRVSENRRLVDVRGVMLLGKAGDFLPQRESPSLETPALPLPGFHFIRLGMRCFKVRRELNMVFYLTHLEQLICTARPKWVIPSPKRSNRSAVRKRLHPERSFLPQR